MSGENECRTTPERKVLGELGNSEPISPTANLRLLTTLASNYNKAPETPQQSTSTANNAAGIETTPDSGGCLKLLSRKDKSLSLLCNKFIELFPLKIQDPNNLSEISLNTTAKALGTEKRRIYDIINVLESLEMASKAGKNQYYWHGHSRLPQTLSKLKMQAIESGLDKKIQEIQRINRAYVEDSFQPCSSSSSLMVPQSPVVNYTFAESNSKEGKSLSLMCKKFVMLFLVSLENGVINLDIAAKVLIGDQDCGTNSAQSRYKTKVRRLYDIANVLSAIKLIEKVDLYNCIIRKPIFKYTGPDVDCTNANFVETLNVGNETQSLVGMITPSKKKCFNFRALSRISRLCAGGSSTPICNQKEPKKRKLFDNEADNLKVFERSQSSPCLNDMTPRTSDKLDESILQVAEMELKKIRSTESKKPKVCTKLFPRHNSDPHSSPAKPHFSLHLENNLSSEQLSSAACPSTTPTVSKENLVNELCSTVSPTVRITVPLELNITPFTIKRSNPKFVRLSHLDMNKLRPVTQSEILKLSVSNTSPSSDVAYLTSIPIKQISPGDTFKAVRVGDTVQLVPIEQCSDKDQSEENNSDL